MSAWKRWSAVLSYLPVARGPVTQMEKNVAEHSHPAARVPSQGAHGTHAESVSSCELRNCRYDVSSVQSGSPAASQTNLSPPVPNDTLWKPNTNHSQCLLFCPREACAVYSIHAMTAKHAQKNMQKKVLWKHAQLKQPDEQISANKKNQQNRMNTLQSISTRHRTKLKTIPIIHRWCNSKHTRTFVGTLIQPWA